MLKRLRAIIEPRVFVNLVINDFKARYVGSYLGIVWGFIQPIITIAIYWFVFSIGLRAGNRPDGTPYIVWLVAGIVPWFFFSEAISVSTGSFLEYSYLVKKLSFKFSIIPIVKISSALIIHIVFAFFAGIIVYTGGVHFSFSIIQIIYYLIAMLCFLYGLSLFTSSIMVFFRDIGNIVNVFIQIGFWAIPIVWSPEVISSSNPLILKILKLNPVYYIVDGYRDSFLGGNTFLDKPFLTAYFWVITIIFFLIGKSFFNKLKPYFADVL